MNKPEKLLIISLIFSIVVLASQRVIFNIGSTTVTLRPRDGILLIAFTYIIIHKKTSFFNTELQYISIVSVALIIYSFLLFFIQSYPITNSIIDIIQIIQFIIALVVLISIIQDRKDSIFTMNLIFLAAIIRSLYAIPHYFVFDGARLVTLADVVLIPTIGLFYSFILLNKSPTQAWPLAATGLLLFLIFMNQTRSVWLFLPMMPICYLIFVERISLKNIFQTSAIFTVTAILLIAVLPVRDRIFTIIDTSSSIAFRSVIYVIGLNIFVDHPLGIGLGNFSEAMQEYASKKTLIYPDWYISLVGETLFQSRVSIYAVSPAGAHSDFIGFLVTLGIFGLLCFIFIWGNIFRRVLLTPIDKYQLIIKLSIIFFFLQSLVNSLFMSGGGIILALLIAMHESYWNEHFNTETRPS